MYADFGFYVAEYKGKLIQDDSIFESVSERATEYIDHVTFDRIGNVTDDEKIMTKVRKCNCELADAIFRFFKSDYISSDSEQPTVKSESNHKYSVSYETAAESNAGYLKSKGFESVEDLMYAVCLKHIGNTGLMYTGQHGMF